MLPMGRRNDNDKFARSARAGVVGEQQTKDRVKKDDPQANVIGGSAK
jgi:hypothetical protein